jgi:hypothetical protein
MQTRKPGWPALSSNNGPRPFNDQTKENDSAIRRQLFSSSTHPEFKVCHTTVPATKHNFKDTTDGPGYP